MLTRKQLKEKVPYGYCKVIADRAKVTKKQVSVFLNDENVKSNNIEMATLEVLAELSQKKKALLEQIA